MTDGVLARTGRADDPLRTESAVGQKARRHGDS